VSTMPPNPSDAPKECTHSGLEFLGDNHGVRFLRCSECASVFVVQDGRIWSFRALQPGEPARH